MPIVQDMQSTKSAESQSGRNDMPQNFQSIKISIPKWGGVGRLKRAQGRAMNVTKHLFAGAGAAVVARTFVAPLERLKLEYIVRGSTSSLQASAARILQTEGVRGFWKGNLLNLGRTAPFKSLNFFAFDTYHKMIVRLRGSEEISNIDRVVAGAAAGATATILCFPMDTLRTRMVAQNKATSSLFACFLELVHHEGATALYKGITPALLSMAPSGAVFYSTYQILRTRFLRSPRGIEHSKSQAEAVAAAFGSAGGPTTRKPKQMELGALRTMLFGGIAGVCAETTIYPFEVVRRHLQLQHGAHQKHVIAVVQNLVEKGGMGAFYSGYLPSVLQVIPSAALSYLVYEFLRARLDVV